MQHFIKRQGSLWPGPVSYVLPFYCSRQRYVLGDHAMCQMAQSYVFLSGIGGLGIEIGK